MTSVRTVTTVQTSGGHSGHGDSNLDALLEDLQTSVLRGQPATLNGQGGQTAKTKIYREETRTVKHVTKPGFQVEYLAPANTTTVVAERAPSPGVVDLTATTTSSPGVKSFKTITYETYNNSSTGIPSSTHRTVGVEDAGLRKNLTELDSLLVDLHHAQRVGFGADQGSRGRSRSNDAVPITRGGVDPGLLEPLDSPPPPPREHVSRTVERTYQTYNSGPPQRYQQSEPKRSGSVNRELIFNESTRSDSRDHQRSTRSPSPLRQPESPQVPRRNVHKEVYYEKTSSGSTRQGRSTSSPHHQERYRDKSPSNQRLHREVYGYDSRTGSVPASPRVERSVEMSPPSQRRHPSPSPGRDSRSTVRTYNYSSHNSSTNQHTTTSPRPYRSPSPISNRSPYVENAPIVELPRRSPSPKFGYQPSGGPPTKVTTTVRTYTYELPPGQTGGYPPGSGYTVQEPLDHTDRPLTYQVSQPVRDPEPTVITYKYSSHNVNKYQTGDQPDDRPRPFPTPSPTPGQNPEPPKKLDELMASFGDTEMIQQKKQPPGYFTSERHTETRTTTSSSEPNGVAVVAPSNVKPPPPPVAPDNGSVRNRGNSKNVAGPPVYYPPGVELFAQKEQEAKMTSTRANGEWEKSRQKESKGSSGGAGVVPVCLPVCCAMPCTIM